MRCSDFQLFLMLAARAPLVRTLGAGWFAIVSILARIFGAVFRRYEGSVSSGRKCVRVADSLPPLCASHVSPRDYVVPMTMRNVFAVPSWVEVARWNYRSRARCRYVMTPRGFVPVIGTAAVV